MSFLKIVHFENVLHFVNWYFTKDVLIHFDWDTLKSWYSMTALWGLNRKNFHCNFATYITKTRSFIWPKRKFFFTDKNVQKTVCFFHWRVTFFFENKVYFCWRRSTVIRNFINVDILPKKKFLLILELVGPP